VRSAVVLLLVVGLAVAAAQTGLHGLGEAQLPAGRPMPWAEITATLLTLSLFLWAAVLRREE
jgi:hypothetical protein